jgi:hypothetical protein
MYRVYSLPSFTIPVKKKNNYCIPTFGPPCIRRNKPQNLRKVWGNY